MYQPSSAQEVVGLSFVRLGIVLLLSGLGYFVFAKRVFEATTRVKVEKDSLAVHSLGDGFDPYWIQSEFEAVQSKVVLFAVITNLNLMERWAARAGRTSDLRINEAYPMLR